MAEGGNGSTAQARGDLLSDSQRHGCADIEFGKHAGRVGLENLGNTCFMNAGLQCLSHLEPFTAFFLSGRYKEEINRAGSLGCQGKLVDAFADLQRELWQSGRTSLRPTALRKQLAGFRPDLFEGFEQQDVQEFLAFCLDGLHEDLNRVKEQPPPLTEEEERDDERKAAAHGEAFRAALSWLRYLERGRSFMVDLLQGQLRSSLTCVKCGFRSRRFEPFLYLSLPVSWDMDSVTDAVREYLAEELLTGSEQWFCERCQAKVDARKKIDLWELPPVLVVQLKRFDYDANSGRFRKIGRLLSAPLSMDLSQYCSTEQVRRLAPEAEIVGPHAYLLFLVRHSTGDDGCYRHGHHAPMLRRQSVTLPELWPQRRSLDGDLRDLLEREARRPTPPVEGGCSSGSGDAAAQRCASGGSQRVDDPLYVMRLPSIWMRASQRSLAMDARGGCEAAVPTQAAGGDSTPTCCAAGLVRLLGL
uniref:ubiquitinyl hydrolase 1 n=1 Tax=Alexandrium monilatum TaxID=311494 RepID=A0A7S4VLF1_9DINO